MWNREFRMWDLKAKGIKKYRNEIQATNDEIRYGEMR